VFAPATEHVRKSFGAHSAGEQKALRRIADPRCCIQVCALRLYALAVTSSPSCVHCDHRLYTSVSVRASFMQATVNVAGPIFPAG